MEGSSIWVLYKMIVLVIYESIYIHCLVFQHNFKTNVFFTLCTGILAFLLIKILVGRIQDTYINFTNLLTYS